MTKIKTNEWIKLGEVGVDSGRLLICDPCYIDGMWEDKGYTDLRLYKDNNTGRIFKFPKDFKSYEDKLELYLGATPNELIEQKIWNKIEIEIDGFSYDAICHNGGKDFKQINYPLGHAGLGVAFSSGYGDGCYEVWGKYNEDGRIVEVKIKMDDCE